MDLQREDMATQDLRHRECLLLLRLGVMVSYLLETHSGWGADLPPEAAARGCEQV